MSGRGARFPPRRRSPRDVADDAVSPPSHSADSKNEGPKGARAPRKLTLMALVAATYFMVSGGPYGLEEIVEKSGYSTALLMLFVTPIIWSLPTGLMVGELAAALPEE